MTPKEQPKKYEDFHEEIFTEIYKRKSKWFLTSVAWMDFDDVAQMISIHIAKKWDQWDQSRSLLPWVNKIISNQFKNILRNNYSNFVRPCLHCPFNLSDPGSNACSFTESKEQDSSCPLFKKWELTKKSAYNIKLPVSMENKSTEVHSITDSSIGIESAEKKLHAEMEKVLSEKHFKVYRMLFIEHLPEEDVAKEMGYKTNEQGRRAGYKQIKNLKKQFKEKAKKILEKKDIFINEKAKKGISL